MAGHSTGTLGRSMPRVLSIGALSEKFPNNTIDEAADLLTAYQVPLSIETAPGGVEHSNGYRSGPTLEKTKVGS